MAGTELTSVRSPRVAAARRLAKRAFRASAGQFLAEGPQAVREALGVEGCVSELFTTVDAENRHRELIAAAIDAGAERLRVSGQVMAAIAQTVTPQGVVAICRFVDVTLASVLTPRPRLICALANIRDPGNAGTVIRAADAAGADAVVLTDASVDVYNGKCVRASAGSLFHLPIVLGASLPAVLDDFREAGLVVLAADGRGRDLDQLTDLGRLAAPAAWIFGNEAWGMPEIVLQSADEIVRVPIYGRAESLNLATAAAVCLYASARAQRAGGEAPR